MSNGTGTSGSGGDLASAEVPDAMLVGAPESLLNLSESDLRKAMGEPAFVRVESGAEMWRYDAQSCKLFVDLYPEGVRHVDLQGEGLDDAARSACVEDMVPEAT